ncbi:hypothetical protein [Sediminispirochaeta bajacaliforniensis]|uniref:hypothetical protein n=1 Tax=Sediminispirochaeta bajacaliforniensis TaxID=148 RepID=UPI000360E530|nr:hypothetical protein [Sediminispirochaeta bajacaliforniensis]
MKKIGFNFLFLFVSVCAFSQTFDLIKRFPDKQPFDFKLSWNKVEGFKPGPRFIGFVDNQIVFLYSDRMEWILMDMEDDYRIVKTIKTGIGGRFLRKFNNDYVLTRIYSNGFLSIYNRDLNHAPILNIALSDSMNINSDYSPFLTENFLFAQTNNNELISWELLEDGRYTYRNVKETQEWLDSGVGEHIGYHIGPSKKHNFGDFRIANSGLYMGYLWRNLIFPEGEYKQISNLRDFEYIGGDSKGLSYYWGIGPLPIDYGKIFKDPNFQVMIAIVDTWTRKVTFRMLEPGSWTPPYDDDHNLLGTFPKAIHPNGDVYFFDADEEKQEYELKRLKNDWWEEMGVDQRKIARIRSNHIPLRNEESNDSGNNGYNFANEYVWVLDEGDSAIDESGTATKWIQVQKIDGRKGWIYETEVYWE